MSEFHHYFGHRVRVPVNPVDLIIHDRNRRQQPDHDNRVPAEISDHDWTRPPRDERPETDYSRDPGGKRYGDLTWE